MLGLLVGMDAARRLTEELLAYDESPRDRTRKRRRGSSRRSVERSRDTSTVRASSEACLR